MQENFAALMEKNELFVMFRFQIGISNLEFQTRKMESQKSLMV